MVVLLALALVAAAPPGLAERIEHHLADDPALAARLRDLPQQGTRLPWMMGGWTLLHSVPGAAPREGFAYIENSVSTAFVQIRNSYDGLNDELIFIGYDAAGDRWVSVRIDHYGAVNQLYARGWQGDRIVFEGNVSMRGVAAHMRQTLEHSPPLPGSRWASFTLTNEELIDGSWRPVDSYNYHGRPVN